MSKMPPKSVGHSDIFYTPESAILPIINYIPKEFIIWECAQGSGFMKDIFIHHGFECIGTDKTGGFDFIDPLSSSLIGDFDCIITNPPYSIKDKFLERCYEIGKPFALLMPITALGEQFRVNLYKKYGIQVLLLPKRVDFVTPSGEGTGAWFYCAWFCWKLLPDKICFA